MRIAPVLLAGAIAGCAGEEMLHGLDERQANEVLIALDEGGIAASKRRDDGEDRWRVEVARGDAVRARRLLAERELPRGRPAGFAEVFASGSMVPTPLEEHARYLHALSGELARTLEAIDGVVEARVHLGLPQPDPLRAAERPQGRGAVLVKCRPASCAAVRALEPGMRALLAGAAESLPADRVSVVVSEASESPPVAPEAPRRGATLLVALATCAALAAVGLVAGGLRARARREVTT